MPPESSYIHGPGTMRFAPTVVLISRWILSLLAILACRVGVADEQRAAPPATGTGPASVRLNVDQGGREPDPIVSVAFSQPEPILPGTPVPDDELPPASALRLEDLEQMALEGNPTLIQASMAVRAAQGGYLQAGLYANPSIGYAGGDMGLEGTSGQQGAVIGQEIITSGKLRLGRAVAGHEIAQARHALEAQRQRVLNDVRAGYYQVLMAQKMTEVHQQLVRISRGISEVTDKALAEQEVSKADALQVRIEAQKANLGLEQVKDHHRAVWQQLATLLGRPEMPLTPLDGVVDEDLPVIDREEIIARLLTESPELAQARAGVQTARCEVALQRAERIPNIEFETWIKHDATVRDTLVDVAIGMPLPLFNRNQGNIVKAQAQLAAARREVFRVELSLQNQASGAYGQYVNARRQADTYRRSILPNAEESLRLTRLGFRGGQFGYLTLLTAQRTYFNNSLEYLANLQELWDLTVQLEGMMLTGGLENPE